MRRTRRIIIGAGALLALATVTAPHADAQLLQRVKQRVKERVTEKIERKAGDAADGAVDRAIGAAASAARDSAKATKDPARATTDSAKASGVAATEAGADPGSDVEYPAGPDDVCQALPGTTIAALLRESGVAGRTAKPLGSATTCMYPIGAGTAMGASVTVAYVPASSAAAAKQGHADHVARLSNHPRPLGDIGDEATIDADEVGAMLAYRVGAMRGFIQVLAPEAAPADREKAAIAIAKAWVPRLTR